MRKSLACVVAIVGLCLPVAAHATVTFERLWQFDSMTYVRGNTAMQTRDGGFIVGAYVWRAPRLIKTDSLGDTVWVKSFPQMYNGGYVCQMPGGGYAILGQSDGQTTLADIFVARTDSFGDTLWTFRYVGPDDDLTRCFAPTSDGGVVIAGLFSDATNWNGGLIKVDSAGTLSWVRIFDPDTNVSPYAVQQTADRGFIIADYAPGEGPWVQKTDSLGEPVWTRHYGYPPYATFWAVRQTDDGGYVVAGGIYNVEHDRGDACLLKLDSFGDTVWTRSYGVDGYMAEAYSVGRTRDGGFILAGYLMADSSVPHYRVYLIRVDSLGETLWTRTFDGNESLADWGCWVEQCADGGFVVTGMADGRNVYLIKTDSAGRVYVGVEETASALAAARRIDARPNPFTRACVFQLPRPLAENEHLKLYDAGGRLVRTLSGSDKLEWDGTDSEGRRLPAGVYVYSFEEGGQRLTGKVVLSRSD